MATVAEDSVIKVAALSGSLRKASYDEGLIVRAAIELSKESIVGMEIEHLDISQLPMQNIDLEGEDHEGSFPPAVEDLRQKILESDCILFSSPEFNYSVSVKGFYHHSHEFQILHIYSLLDDNIPAPLKNAIDWASRPPNVWADKAAAIISASAAMGGARGQLHLRQIGRVVPRQQADKRLFLLDTCYVSRRPAINIVHFKLMSTIISMAVVCFV
ncbi:hypothetical protein Peur_019521 [Populus x canadensis]